MIDFDYAARQLVGVWRMAFTRGWEGASDWRDDIDRSVDGVFKSFWAIAFAAPFALLSYVALHRAVKNIPSIDSTPLLEAPLAVMLGVEFLSYAVDWAVSIGAIVLMARALEATRTVTDTIITYNWAQVFAVALQSIPIALMGLFGTQAIAGILALPILVIVLVLFWGVFRQAMELKPGMAVAMIFLLTLINIIVNSVVVGGATMLLQPASSG